MPQETPQEIHDTDLTGLVAQVLNQQGHQDDVLHEIRGQLAAMQRELTRFGDLADRVAAWHDFLVEQVNKLDRIENWARQQDARLGDIEADVSKLSKLAEQAEKFLHNPIGAYKAARGKLIPRGPSA